MVDFVTLFIGLVIGPHPVEVMADSAVAAVELRLDGDAVARLEGPPWRTIVDFGPELVPHALEATAFDASGNVTQTAVQAVNRPRPEAEAALMIERDAAGRPVAARLTWETVTEMRPIVAEVTLDGEPLEVESLERFPLPPAAEGEFHFLQVDLTFAGEISAHTQAVYGGTHVGETSGDLTAIPVVFRGRPPKLEELAGWFLENGEPRRVAAVEKGPADVLIVRADGVLELAAALPGQPGGLGSAAVSSATGMISLGSADVGATAGASDRLQSAMAFGGGDALRLILPRARTLRHESVVHKAFPSSPRITRETGGLYWTLLQKFHEPALSATERIADAVAVAGMRAAWGNRRRAVVLVLAGDGPDTSVLSPRAVRKYLRTLDVPLFVWHFEAGSEPGAPATERLREWPEAERIGSWSGLNRAARTLRKRLDDQRVVWIDGRHPPEAIRLAAHARARRVGGAQGTSGP